jgi:hypothetical protein
MKRLYAFLLFVCAATPMAARIISYAPYSDRISRSGHHERTTRRFVVIEEISFQERQLILHDSAGHDEPRVIPLPPAATTLQYAALYELKKTPGAPPVLLVDGYLTTDLGLTWQKKIREYWIPPAPAWDFDTGGPFVQGLGSSILPGTDEVPFVVSAANKKVWAVPLTGDAIVLEDFASLVGRNAAGNKFLIHTPTDIRVAGLDGSREVVTQVPAYGHYSGWLTGDDAVYLVAARLQGRFLSFHRKNFHQFIAGPYGSHPALTSSGWGFPEMASFAVPTHDFNGAWIIQRRWDRQTTLSRHTPAEGLTEMWSDPSGPEVEALIAGASGETVLIQVHRDRPMPEPVESVPTDPALAVWKVGDPMPADYDELFLAEQPDKGFVHVDVDRLLSGEPFVFNSGLLLPDDDPGDISSGGGGGGDIIQEWGVVRGSLKQHLVVPGVARTHGTHGSRWFTDVTIYNPLDEPQSVEMRFVPMGVESSGVPYAGLILSLAPREIRVVEDVLQSFAVDNGGGTLHVLPARTVNVTSRTYSRSTAGTYGFGMYAIDFFTAAGPRFPLTFAGAFAGEHFRTNVLLTDTSGRGAEAELRSHRGPGTITAGSTISAPAGGTMQFNGVTLHPAGPVAAAQKGGALVLETKRGTSIPMVIAIDNRTNDATYLPPDVATEAPRVIPAIGHLDGAQGSRFRSDLYLFNGEAETSSVTLQAFQWDSNTSREVVLLMQPHESRTIPDALMTLFGMSGLAQLRFRSVHPAGWGTSAGGVRVTSRTYNVDSSGATSGCLIPPLNGFNIVSSAERLEIVTPVPKGFRVNLGLLNLATNPNAEEAFLIAIYDEAGKLVGEWTRWMTGAGVQINNLFGSAGIAPPRAARIVVWGLNSGQIFGAYVTLTDNLSNDTLYLAGQLGAKPD